MKITALPLTDTSTGVGIGADAVDFAGSLPVSDDAVESLVVVRQGSTVWDRP